MEMKYETITVEEKAGICTLTLNRPERLNSLNIKMFEELAEVINEINDSERIKVLVIKGRGKAFSAGGDMDLLKYLNGMETASQIQRVLSNILRLGILLKDLNKPTIASIHGYCIGAGMSLVMLCDIKIASEESIFGVEFINMGIIPDIGACYMLPRLVGLTKAKELIITSKRFNAREAESMGLINKVVSEKNLEVEVMKWADKIASLPALAVGIAKMALNKSLYCDFKDMIEFETLAQPTCLKSDDHKEAVAAFLEKRKPRFLGK